MRTRRRRKKSNKAKRYVRYALSLMAVVCVAILIGMPLMLERCDRRMRWSVGTPHYGWRQKPAAKDCVHPEGIDLSHHNEAYDWSLVDAQFVYIRASHGCNIKDRSYHTHLKDAQRQGIAVGAYHFLTFKTSAETQFRFFTSIVSRKDFTLRPMLDVEEESFKHKPRGFTNSQARQVIADWCRLCRKEYGVAPIIYTTEKIYERLDLNDSAFSDCLWWVANYNNVVDYEQTCIIPYTLHQYSDQNYVEGFYGHIDCNRFHTGMSVENLKI